MTIPVSSTIELALVEPAHAQPIYDLAAANRVYLRQWLHWVDNMQDVSFIQQFIRNSQYSHLKGTDHAFVILEDGHVVGRIGVYKVDTNSRIGEIGYWVAEAAQGKGIITAACKALVTYCFDTLQLNRIEIKCAVDNHKSQAIPERLGFVKEGVLRQSEWLHDRFWDLVLYSAVREDWSGK